MSVEDESTSCYCLLDPFACHVLLDSFGTYALTGEPITDCAVKQLKVAVFGCMSCNSLDYNLRVYCVDNTPCAFQVSLLHYSCSFCENYDYLYYYFSAAVLNSHDLKEKEFILVYASEGIGSTMAGAIVYGSRSRKLADYISRKQKEEMRSGQGYTLSKPALGDISVLANSITSPNSAPHWGTHVQIHVSWGRYFSPKSEQLPKHQHQ